MKTVLLALALVATVMTGCTTFDKFVGVADTTINIPIARSELESYLTPAELESVSDELALLDRTYQPIADAVFGRADISLEDAVSTAFKTAFKKAQLETAYKEIRRVVWLHKAATGEAIPVNLARVSGDIEALYDEWDSVVASNQRAELYLRVAAQLILPL